jgi:hypothetical protein
MACRALASISISGPLTALYDQFRIGDQAIANGRHAPDRTNQLDDPLPVRECRYLTAQTHFLLVNFLGQGAPFDRAGRIVVAQAVDYVRQQVLIRAVDSYRRLHDFGRYIHSRV